MKKTLYLLSVTLLFLFIGCSNTPKTKREFEAKITKTSSYANIEIKEELNNMGIPTGITVTLENKTDDVIEIDWNSSNLGGSNLFLEGQKFKEAGTFIPSTVIAPYSKLTKAIFSASNIYYYSGEFGGWRQNEQLYPAKLVLKLLKDNKAEFIVVDLNAKITKIDSTIQQ